MICLLCLAGIASLGCESAKKTPTESKKAVTVKKTGLTLPADLLIYAGSSQPIETLKSLSAIANQVQPGMPDATMMVPPLLQQQFRLMSPAGIDLKKSIAIALFDQQIFGRDPSATLIGMTTQAQFEASIPKTEQKKDDGGNAYSYTKWKGAKYPVFVNFIGTHAVLTRHKDLFAKHKGFITELARHKFEESGSVFVSVNNAMTANESTVNAGMKKMKGQVKKGLAQANQGEASGLIEGMLEGAVEFARNMRAITMTLGLSGEGIRIGTRFSVKAGTSTANTWSQIAGGNHDLIQKSPADSVGFVSVSLKGDALKDRMAEFTTAMLGVISSTGNMDAKLSTQMAAATKSWLKAIDGRMLARAHSYPGNMGLMPSIVMGLKDKSKARGAMLKMAAAIGAAPAVKANYAKMGMTVEQNINAYAVLNEPVMVQKSTFATPSMQTTLMGPLLESHTVFGDDLAAIAYGPQAKIELEHILGGKYNGLDKKPGVPFVMKTAATNPFLLLYLAPIELAQRLQLGGMNPMAAALAGLKSNHGLGLSVGKRDADLELVMAIPTGLLKEGMAAFMKVKGGL
jgi:hypothetical protein